MKPKLTLFAVLLVFSAIFLSACGSSSQLTASSWPGVLAAGEQVFLAFGPHIYALDAASGNSLWTFPAEPDNKISFFSTPALTPDGSQLIAGGYDKTLYSINPANGQSTGWSFTGATNRYIANVLVTDAGIFAPNAGGSLFALNFAGDPLWSEAYRTEEPQWSAPATDGEHLYISSLDHFIHAVHAADGERLWSRDLGAASPGTPALAEGRLYVGTFGSKVMALDAASGNVLWEFITQDWVWAGPAVSGNLVIAADISGLVYALDATTGAQVWRFDAESPVFATPLVTEDHIYFGTEAGKFYALTLDNQVDWFYTHSGKIYSPAASNGELIFVSAIEGEALLTALDANGAARWSFSLEE